MNSEEYTPEKMQHLFVAVELPDGYAIQLADNSHAPFLAALEIAAATRFPPATIPDHIRSDSVRATYCMRRLPTALSG
ncbi:MAG: hypothetical protein LBE31_11700 [Deltaproteobacteria bacterium]|jgi:hypothetical protein|nr:hypothetical protein [Deltaproteobacteria bacterium]